jgi:hypothetical protein
MKAAIAALVAGGVIAGLCAQRAAGNGGPFLVKYPGGDPAAKGVLARLDPSLKPAKETRLRVVKEDLAIEFAYDSARFGRSGKLPPLVEVTAAYTIENPTDKRVQVDFGFPILRGIYLTSDGMGPREADVDVTVGKKAVKPVIISNSAIYGLIRQQARERIENGVAADAELARRVADVRGAWRTPPPAMPPTEEEAENSEPVVRPGHARKPTAEYLPARERLRAYLTSTLRWSERDAVLMIEYASIDFGLADWPWQLASHDRWDDYVRNMIGGELKDANLGPLIALGEQKATQLFALLASRFEESAAGSYEAIFAAWGGDVRDRAIDLNTGQIRPRELTLPKTTFAGVLRKWLAGPSDDHRLTVDRTVYARIEYLDPEAWISETERASCEAILKNLPVVFTFAPMNLLHYRVKFPARSTRVVAIKYQQYAYADTLAPASYQLAYVLHPATLWKGFGPINLTVRAPKGIACRASAAIQKTGEEAAKGPVAFDDDREIPTEVYQSTLNKPEEKQGELFIGVDKDAWDKAFPPQRREASPGGYRSG